MKPFVLIQSRPEKDAADNEYAAFLRYTGLDADLLLRIDAQAAPIPNIDLNTVSGILVGGGPFNYTDAEKSATQQRVESDMTLLLDKVIAQDFPFFGACYGVGLLSSHQNGVMSRQYGEPVGAVHVQIVEDDPIFEGMPREFDAFVGHKEACEQLPADATLLASGITCPVQMFRIKQNVYATQFHPELDADGLETRIRIYKDHGYFQPEEADALITAGHNARVHEPMALLRNFVERYRTPN